MKKLTLLAILIVVCSIMAPAIFAKEKLITVLGQELERNMKTLRTQEAPPYYLSYRVDDMTESTVSAVFGTVSNTSQDRTRHLTIDLRVGSPELDNTHEVRDDYNSFFKRNETGKLPLTDGDAAIRQIVWLETDKYYRAAADQFAKVKANVAVKVKEEDKSIDFSSVTPEKYYEAPLPSSKQYLNTKEWEEKLKKYTALFLQNKDILSGSAFVRYTVIRKYFISSEGTEVAHNVTQLTLHISASVQADDGMRLPLYVSYFAYQPSGMPSEQTVLNDVQKMIEKLMQLKNAPIVDSYTGPAILSADSAGVFFHEIFGHRTEGTRMKSESDAQTFKKKVGQQVLHPDLSVIMDPTRKKYDGQDLNGFYLFDDQGVRGRRVDVIKDGVLKEFLMARTPIENFPYSNGHGRAYPGYQPVSRQSNLIVETKTPYTDAQLKEKLREELKKQNKEYGFMFTAVTGGFTMTGRYMPNAFNVTPTEVYRVYADGRPDELVRGVDLVGTPLAMFSKISAAGDSPTVFTGMCGAESGWVPVTSISPALLVDQIEVQRKRKSQDKPPLLPRPDAETMVE